MRCHRRLSQRLRDIGDVHEAAHRTVFDINVRILADGGFEGPSSDIVQDIGVVIIILQRTWWYPFKALVAITNELHAPRDLDDELFDSCDLALPLVFDGDAEIRRA